MSQTAAQINQEILDRLNRGNEIGTDRIYDWMNRTKRRALSVAEPLDFMIHEAVIATGSGSCVPGQSDISRNQVLLPRNFHALRHCEVASSYLSEDEADLIFGSSADVPVFTYPTMSTVAPNYLSTDHVTGEQDLIPFYGPIGSLLMMDLPARGITYDLIGSFQTAHECTILSPTVNSFMADPPQAEHIIVKVDATELYPINRFSAVLDGMAAAGYVDGPWPGKVLSINPPDIYPLIGDGIGFIRILYSRFLWDYNSPCQEALGAPIITQDIVSETAPDLLIEGALEQAWRYLNDDTRADRHEIRAWGNPALGRPNGLAYEFRKHHRIAQIESRLSARRRFAEGTRIVRAP